MSESSGSTLEQSVRRMFVKWLLLSTAAIFAVALISGARASAADVFIDEGEGDFDKPTPVETPVSSAGSGAGLDFDADFNASKGDSPDASPIMDPAQQVVDTATTLPVTTEPTAEPKTAEVAPLEVAPVKAAKTQATKSKAAKKAPKVAVKTTSKAKKVATKSGKAKATKKTVVVKSKKKSVVAKSKGSKKATKRKVASAVKYAGGQYVSTSRECAMESAPGAGDTIGTTKAQRKLWVEDAGDAGYWKVYSKSGQAAFLSRSCF